MPVPKRKRSRQRRDTRFANKGITPVTFGSCDNCEAIILPHLVCKGCGFYRGRKVLFTKADRAEKRAGLLKVAQDKVQKAAASSATNAQE